VPALTFDAPRSAPFALMLVITIRAPGSDVELSGTAVINAVILAPEIHLGCVAHPSAVLIRAGRHLGAKITRTRQPLQRVMVQRFAIPTGWRHYRNHA
jgi:hypothetical protein